MYAHDLLCCEHLTEPEIPSGGVSERFKELVLKTSEGATPPWVRIPPPPPTKLAVSVVLAIAASIVHAVEPVVPAWVYPINPPASVSPAPYDNSKPLHVPNSKLAFTQAQLNDLFSAPDWHPNSHSAMPSVVSHGDPPDVYACGYCHTPGGRGRPENAALAGLPAAYIAQQVADFRSGARKSAWPGPYTPTDRMIHTASHADAQQVAEAAKYFSAQRLRSRVI